MLPQVSKIVDFYHFFQFSYSSLCGTFCNAHIFSFNFLFSFENPIANIIPCKCDNNGPWKIIIKFAFS